MPCFNTVPISIIPPTAQGQGPLVWQNGSQINRLNSPLNPSLVLFDGSVTRFGDGSAQSPISLPNIQQVSGSPTFILGANSSGKWGFYNQTVSGLGTPNQILTTNSSGTATLWQTGVTGVTNGSTSNGTNTAVGGTGLYGEFITSSVAQASAVTLSGNAPKTVTSITLTSGDWDVRGQVDYVNPSTTATALVTLIQQGINVGTPNAFGGQDTYSILQMSQITLGVLGVSTLGMPIRIQRVNIPASTTTVVYLIASSNFSGSLSAFGTIEARRVR